MKKKDWVRITETYYRHIPSGFYVMEYSFAKGFVILDNNEMMYSCDYEKNIKRCFEIVESLFNEGEL